MGTAAATAIDHVNHALALRRAGRTEEAIDHLTAAAKLAPDDPEIFNILGNTLRTLGRLSEARDAYLRTLALKPGHAIAHNNLALALQDGGKLDDAIASFRTAMRNDPSYTNAHSNLLLCMNYHEGVAPDELLAEHRAFGARFDTPARSAAKPRIGDASQVRKTSGASQRSAPAWRKRRVRVGYLSPDFRQHSIAFFMWKILQHHDRSRFEVTCYSDCENPDPVTEHLARLPENFVPVADLSDDALASRIRGEKIDLLIDLAGHTGGNRLSVLAARVAPVQATWLGYPNTTGVSTIDYRITDAIADPPGESDRLHTERLIRLPGAFACYWAPAGFPEVVPPPATARKQVTFAVFTNFAKVRPPMLRAWARILARVPESKLLLQALSFADREVRDATTRAFCDSGITSDRVELRDFVDFPQYIAMHNDVDVILDTFPFNGHTTTCHALWTGVPVVTLAGAVHRSRLGASVLTNIGLPELIARDEEEYVRTACDLADDLPRLSAMRFSLRQRMAQSPLFDGPSFTRDLESALEQMLLASATT